jgi:hypothetical protein
MDIEPMNESNSIIIAFDIPHKSAKPIVLEQAALAIQDEKILWIHCDLHDKPFLEQLSNIIAIPESVTGDEAGHVGRVLFQHAIQPQICDSVAERAATGKEAATETSAIGELWSGSDSAVGGDLGSGGLSLVGSSEGRAAIVAAMDSKTISSGCGNRKEVVADQRDNDGSALEVEEAIVEQEALWRDQAGHSAEASYSDQDGLMEREGSGFCRGGLGIALG